jgi:hypothetical protein
MERCCRCRIGLHIGQRWVTSAAATCPGNALRIALYDPTNKVHRDLAAASREAERMAAKLEIPFESATPGECPSASAHGALQ